MTEEIKPDQVEDTDATPPEDEAELEPKKTDDVKLDLEDKPKVEDDEGQP